MVHTIYYLAGNIDCLFQRGLEESKESKRKLLATTYVTKLEEKVECPRYFVTHFVVLSNFLIAVQKVRL